MNRSLVAALLCALSVACEANKNGDPGQDGGTTNANWKLLFSDDFNRADGAVGVNYVTEVYPTAGSIGIVNNEVEFAAAPSATTYSKMQYSAAVTEMSVRATARFIRTTSALNDYALAVKSTTNGSAESYYQGGVFESVGMVKLQRLSATGGVSPSVTLDLGSKSLTTDQDVMYSIVLTANDGEISVVVTNTVTGDSLSISGKDDAPIASGKVSVVGTHLASAKVNVDDFKIETHE
jgi:hypothetical protein